MPRVVFLLVPEFHLLDLSGPAQVFSAAADLGHDYRLSYVAERPEVPSAQGVTVRADVDWPELDADDLVVVPGWRAPTLAGRGHHDNPRGRGGVHGPGRRTRPPLRRERPAAMTHHSERPSLINGRTDEHGNPGEW